MSYNKQIDSLVNAIRKQTIEEICEHFPELVKSEVVKKMSKPKSPEELAEKKVQDDAKQFAKEKQAQDKKDAIAAKKLLIVKEKADKLALKEKEKADKLALKEKEKADKLALKEKEKADKLALKEKTKKDAKVDKKKGRPAKKQQVVNSTAILTELENAVKHDDKGAEEEQSEEEEEQSEEEQPEEEQPEEEQKHQEKQSLEQSEEEIEVDEFQFEGISYMKDANNVIYDPSSNEIVGVWNGTIITPYKLHDDF
jgi:hypothetical protein